MNIPAEMIRREVENHGVLSFARFMQLALYHPEGGYYETVKTPGQRGDFYTSVSVGRLFGELLAFQFAGWLEELKTSTSFSSHPSTLSLIEAGAHDGQLAADILNWLQIHRPKLLSEMNYCIIEPSPQRQAWQRETLKIFAPRVHWFSDFKSIPPETPKWNGILFSNELLDAFPVQRFSWDATQKIWFEWGVGIDGKKFVWAKMANTKLPLTISQLPSSLMDVFPGGYTIEVSPAAENWWREAANAFERGWLMTFDYGLTKEEVFSPARTNGTLRAYFQHRISDDILANAGQQDITAHVHFSTIKKIGEEAGLITEFFNTQTKFLAEILAAAAKSNSFGEWDSKRTRQFQTLTHPEHLGRAFRVLVQSR